MLLTRGWHAGIKKVHLPSAGNVDPVLRAAGLFPGGVLAALATSEVKSGFAHTHWCEGRVASELRHTTLRGSL